MELGPGDMEKNLITITFSTLVNIDIYHNINPITISVISSSVKKKSGITCICGSILLTQFAL